MTFVIEINYEWIANGFTIEIHCKWIANDFYNRNSWFLQ